MVLGRWGSGQLTWLEQWRPPPTNIWEPIAKHQATQISTERWALVSSKHGEGVSTKDGGRQSEGDSGTRCTFGNFSSLHSMSCWCSVPGLAQVRPRPFSARHGSPLGRLETHQSQYERHNCTIIRFIMYIKMMHMPWPPDKTPHGSSYSACGIAGMYSAHVAQYIY